jgi:hypothetical protein
MAMAKPDNPETWKPKGDMTPREAAEQDEEQTRRGIQREEEQRAPRPAGEEQREAPRGDAPPDRR